MNLKEYLSQKDPVRMPRVIIEEYQYIVASTSKHSNGEIRKRVYFKTKNTLLAGVEYCLIGSSFYTVDRDGNPKNRSCFSIILK